jgi:hypothetical protein
MAYGFQVPRQRPMNVQTKTLNTGTNLFDLQRQAPVSEGQQLAEQQNTEGLRTGQWADVQSAQNATNRQNALRTSQALQATRGTFARSGVDTSPEAASRAQDQSFSAAEGQNLNGTNAVNQLQRQYRNDAITQAGKNEQGYTDRQNATTNTIGTLGNLDISNKNADINQQNADTTRYSAEGDIADKTGRLALDTTKEANSFGIERGKLALDTTKVGNDLYLGGRSADTADRNADTNLLDVNNRNALGNRNATNDERKTTSDIYLGGRAADTADRNADTNTTRAANDFTLGTRSADTADRNADTNLLDVKNRNTLGEGNLALDKTKVDNDYTINSGNLQLGKDRLESDKNIFTLERGDKNKSTTMDQINAIQDPVARNLALKAYYNGEDVSKAISGNIDANGQLINKSMSPGTAAYQAKVDELQATYPDKPKAEIEQMVRDRAAQSDAINKGVIDTGVKSVAASQAKDVLATNPQALTPEQKNALVASGDIKSFEPGNMPVGDSARNLIGQPVKIGGTFYKVDNALTIRSGYTRSGDPRHTDTVVLVDDKGNKKYFYNGLINDKQVAAA